MAGIPRFAQAGGKGKTKLGATRPFSFSAKGHSGHGAKGMGKGKGGMKRHRKVLKDNVHGITKGDIRRLARRGGVKRISAAIYDDVRSAMVTRLQGILKDCCIFLEHSGRKTVTVNDVIFALKRLGSPIWGFGGPTLQTHGRR